MVEHPPDHPDDDYWKAELPEALQAATEGGLPKYDAIVVDEAQDFADAYWLPLQYCLDDPEAGVLYVFLDAAQRLYSPESSLIEELPRYELPVNVRNTQAIHRAAAPFPGENATQAPGPKGRPVEVVELKAGAALEKEVGKVVHRLLHDEQVPAEDIAVLTGRRPDAVGLDRDSKFAGLPVIPADRPRKGHITLDTVHRFKGLDAPVVVLTGLEGIHAATAEMLLYVGITRARSHLVILARDETLEQYGFR